MSRRLSWVAVFATALLALAVMPAVAVGPFGPAQVLLGGTTPCESPDGDAAIAVDGTTRGFANCTREGSAQIWFFRSTPGVAPFLQATPYTGVVLAVAWDGLDSMYVVLQSDSALLIGKRIDSSGVYAPLTRWPPRGISFRFDADVVASNGRWWAVWQRTDGRQPRPERSCSNGTPCSASRAAPGSPPLPCTSRPTLAYANGRMTMVWIRESRSHPRSRPDRPEDRGEHRRRVAVAAVRVARSARTPARPDRSTAE